MVHLYLKVKERMAEKYIKATSTPLGLESLPNMLIWKYLIALTNLKKLKVKFLMRTNKKMLMCEPWHGEALALMRSIKTALDPDNIMNPGKVIRV